MAGSKPYRLDPKAQQEIIGADDWYAQRSADASVEFLDAVSDGLEKISNAPLRWPKYIYGTRRFVFHHFPFSMVYLDEPDELTVVALAHSKRKPGYWKQRL